MTEEDVKRIQVIIALTPGHISFDNDLTRKQEIWLDGVLERTIPANDVAMWATTPNPWLTSEDGAIHPLDCI